MDDELIARAQAYTGFEEKTARVREALEAPSSRLLKIRFTDVDIIDQP
jgi:hypothetical protein